MDSGVKATVEEEIVRLASWRYFFQFYKFPSGNGPNSKLPSSHPVFPDVGQLNM